MFSSDKIDYKSSGTAARATNLEVPPDLTQLSRDSRYQQPSGSVSASTFQTAASATGRGRGRRRDADGRAAGGWRLSPGAARRRALAEHDPVARGCLSQGARLLEGLRLQSRRGSCRHRRDRDRLGRRPRQAAARHHPQNHRQGLRRPLLDRQARQVPHPRRAHADRLRHLHHATQHGRDLQRSAQGKHDLAAGAGRSAARGRVPVTADGSPRREGRAGQGPGRQRRRRRRRAARCMHACCPTSPGRPCRSTTISTGPGAASASPSTAAASRSRTAIAHRASTSCATSIRNIAGREEPNFFQRMFSSKKADEGAPVKYRVKVTGSDTAQQQRRRPRFAGQAGKQRQRQAHRRPAPRWPEVSLRQAVPGWPA